MRKRPFPETVLALTIGRDRGTAIYGDLVELAATRGRTWFWVAYARTLVALTWRTAVGALAGLAFFPLLDKLTGNNAGFTLWVAYMANPAIANLAIALLILIPYAAVRYGLRDRMVCLAWVVFVPNAVAGLYLPVPLIFVSLVAVPAVALCVRRWRGPASGLIGTVAVGAAISACLSKAGWYTGAALTLPVMMLVCSVLRRRLHVSAR